MSQNASSIARLMQGDASFCEEEIYLGLEECIIRVRSNSPVLIDTLARYFSHFVIDASAETMDVIAIESDAQTLGFEFTDWKREPGKTGRKDAYVELVDGRLVQKVRTGMLFLQSGQHRVAVGPCLENDNQITNFICSQYMTWLQNRGWLICHASGLVYGEHCLGIAGFSGGGKSTLMLHILDDESVSYMTNDRLFVRSESDQVLARGIPKMPRINPGTIVHNSRLHGLIPDEERQTLLEMPVQELWHIEDKYDVDIERVYGAGRIVSQAAISSFLILNWTHDSPDDTTLEAVDLAIRRDLLGALMKAPGSFYQYPDGSFDQDTASFDEEAYLRVLKGVKIYEASGKIDFGKLIKLCGEIIFT